MAKAGGAGEVTQSERAQFIAAIERRNDLLRRCMQVLPQQSMQNVLDSGSTYRETMQNHYSAPVPLSSPHAARTTASPALSPIKDNGAGSGESSASLHAFAPGPAAPAPSSSGSVALHSAEYANIDGADESVQQHEQNGALLSNDPMRQLQHRLMQQEEAVAEAEDDASAAQPPNVSAAPSQSQLSDVQPTRPPSSTAEEGATSASGVPPIGLHGQAYSSAAYEHDNFPASDATGMSHAAPAPSALSKFRQGTPSETDAVASESVHELAQAAQVPARAASTSSPTTNSRSDDSAFNADVRHSWFGNDSASAAAGFAPYTRAQVPSSALQEGTDAQKHNHRHDNQQQQQQNKEEEQNLLRQQSGKSNANDQTGVTNGSAPVQLSPLLGAATAVTQAVHPQLGAQGATPEPSAGPALKQLLHDSAELVQSTQQKDQNAPPSQGDAQSGLVPEQKAFALQLQQQKSPGANQGAQVAHQNSAANLPLQHNDFMRYGEQTYLHTVQFEDNGELVNEAKLEEAAPQGHQGDNKAADDKELPRVSELSSQVTRSSDASQKHEAVSAPPSSAAVSDSEELASTSENNQHHVLHTSETASKGPDQENSKEEEVVLVTSREKRRRHDHDAQIRPRSARTLREERAARRRNKLAAIFDDASDHEMEQASASASENAAGNGDNPARVRESAPLFHKSVPPYRSKASTSEENKQLSDETSKHTKATDAMVQQHHSADARSNEKAMRTFSGKAQADNSPTSLTPLEHQERHQESQDPDAPAVKTDDQECTTDASATVWREPPDQHKHGTMKDKAGGKSAASLFNDQPRLQRHDMESVESQEQNGLHHHRMWHWPSYWKSSPSEDGTTESRWNQFFNREQQSTPKRIHRPEDVHLRDSGKFEGSNMKRFETARAMHLRDNKWDESEALRREVAKRDSMRSSDSRTSQRKSELRSFKASLPSLAKRKARDAKEATDNDEEQDMQLAENAVAALYGGQTLYFPELHSKQLFAHPVYFNRNAIGVFEPLPVLPV